MPHRSPTAFSLAACHPLRLAGRLALTTALGTLALGYGRRAYAGSCSPAGSIILCSGPADPATDLAQSIAGAPLSVQTSPGFGLDTSLIPGTALDLAGTGGLSLDGSAAGLAIVAAGTGVRAINTGGGAVTVDTRGGAVTAGDVSVYPPTAFTGIVARNDAGGSGMTIRTGDINATDAGILSRNAGGGAFVIDTTGGELVTNGLSISAVNEGTDLLIATGNVRSFFTSAITAINDGTGRTAIDTTAGLVSASNAVSIYGRTKGVDLDIRAADARGGIRARNDGTGSVSIDTTAGAIESLSASGIYVLAALSAASVSVRTANVSGTRGVRVINNGTGGTTVDTTAGQVVGDNAGIRVQHGATAGPVSVTAGYVRGAEAGIWVTSDNDAPVVIDSRSGQVIGISNTGILATARNIGIRSADVYGGIEGIAASNEAGSISIDSTAGSVTGNSQSGINVFNFGTDASITTGNVTGATIGISLDNKGTGAVTVDTTGGAVTGQAENGIRILNYGTDISLTTASVTGALYGINVDNKGTGAVTIDASGGTVVGGIKAVNSGTSLAIAAGRTIGQYGIDATNNGTGDLTITASSGNVDDGFGPSIVKARNDGRNTQVTLGGIFSKVDADHRGSGLALVDTSNARMGSNFSDFAIKLSASSGSARIVTGDVEFESIGPGMSAIILDSTGDGPAEVDTRGASVVASTFNEDEPVTAIQASATHGITVRTAGVQALTKTAPDREPPGDVAIQLHNTGTGDVVIDTTGGSVMGAIQAISSGGAGDVTISTAAVTSETASVAAIEASRTGAGDIIIDSSRGPVTSFGNDGVHATSDGTSGDMRITTADVTAKSVGVLAEHGGTGALRIDTSAGAVTSTFRLASGIVATSNGMGLDISAGDVSGYRFGILAVNNGSGDLSITGAGTVSGEYSAVRVFNFGDELRVSLAGLVNGGAQFWQQGSGNASLDLRAASITSRSNGVELLSKTGDAMITLGTVVSESMNLDTAAAAFSQEGSGELVIDSRAGTLTSRFSYGLFGQSLGAGSVTIQTGSISAALQGINVANYGGGNISIDSGAGQITSTNGAGISATNDSASADLRIRSASVTAAPSALAVMAENQGTGSTRIEVAQDGVVAGGAGAIGVSHAGSGSFAIDNAGTLRRLSDDPTALVIDAKSEGAAGGLTLSNTGRITGTISLTAKDDRFVNDGTWNVAGGTSDFGAGNDVFENRSNLTFVAAANPARAETTTLANLETFRNSGTVTLADGAVGDTIVTPGDFDGAGGTIRVDMMADGSAADLFRIMGSVTGGPSRVAINYLGTGGTVGTIGVPLVQVDGTTKDGDFRISNPVWEGLVYKLVLGPGNSWSATPAFTLAALFSGLERDQRVASQLLDGQQAGIVNAMAQDCTRFGASGACVSLAGRSTALSGDAGSSDALVLTAAVQPGGSDWRMGAFLDQRVAGELPEGFSFQTMGPTLGGFADFGAADGLGPRLRLSGAWSTARLGISRPQLAGIIEGGEAEAGFNGWGFGGEVGYGLSLGNTVAVTPFAGLRRVVSTREAYAEQGGSSDFPLSADAMSLAQTTLSTGATLGAALGDALSLTAGFGVEHDLSVAEDGFTGSLEDIGTFAIGSRSDWKRTRLFGGAGLDYEMEEGIGLTLSASARQLPLDNAVDVTATAGVRASF